jgi:(p)ppGpp synthase/HD superfamily hydrolase
VENAYKQSNAVFPGQENQKITIQYGLPSHGHLYRTGKSGILVGGNEDLMVRFAKCCNPIPGDPIIGL